MKVILVLAWFFVIMGVVVYPYFGRVIVTCLDEMRKMLPPEHKEQGRKLTNRILSAIIGWILFIMATVVLLKIS